MAFHEGKACDAVIRVLEARERGNRRDVRSREKDGDPAPIELTCRIGDRPFAFEHTGIEPFAGHVKFEAEARTMATSPWVGRTRRPTTSRNAARLGVAPQLRSRG
jgi:hypothetical protein